MFHHLTGIVTDILPGSVVLECGGVGFLLNVSAYTMAGLSVGEEAKLYTVLQVREDAMELSAFLSLDEKRLYEHLVSVSGVGPKAALSVLSVSSPETISMAILSGDDKLLTSAQGIGKKIAQRIVLELKDKLQKDNTLVFSAAASPVGPSGTGKAGEAAAALQALGFSPSDASAALRGIDPELPVEEIIRCALKNSMK